MARITINTAFSSKEIEAIEEKANEIGVTKYALLRMAVIAYLKEKKHDSTRTAQTEPEPPKESGSPRDSEEGANDLY